MISKRLQNIIRNAVSAPTGSQGSGKEEIQTDFFRQELIKEQGRAGRMLNIALAMIFLVFIVMIYFLITNTGNTSFLTVIMAASGVSISGLIWFAIQTARERSQSSMLLLLADRLPAEDTLSAMNSLINRKTINSK